MFAPAPRSGIFTVGVFSTSNIRDRSRRSISLENQQVRDIPGDSSSGRITEIPNSLFQRGR
jgi:hypothetical protein